MIQLKGIRKRFGEVQVLDGIDLDIRAGRVTAIVGPNSSGKTTLIKSILGLTRADEGTVAIDGTITDRDGSYRTGIGYMPQIARYPENLTGADLLAMMADLRRTPARDEELIDSLGLRDHLEKPLRVLSGGTRQKINAALAFMFAPRILILDEPTAGLDPAASAVLKDKIRAEQVRGRTSIVTSHVRSELDEVSDDIALLVEGRIRYVGPVVDLKRLTRQLSLELAVARFMDGEAGRMTITLRIASYAVRDLARSRWLAAYAGFFMVATFALLQFSDNQAKAMLSLVNVVLLIVPLANVVFGTMYLQSSREFVELLLAQPIRRRQLFSGCYSAWRCPFRWR